MNLSKNKHEQSKSYAFDKLGDTLSLLLEESKLTLAELAKNTNIPIATIKRIRYGTSSNPTVSSLLPIASFFSITIDELLGLKPLPQERAKGVYSENKFAWTKVPLLTWDQLFSINLDTFSQELCAGDYVQTDVDISQFSFALIVEEDNWDLFQKDTRLIFDMKKSPKHKSFVLIKNENYKSVAFFQLLIFDNKKYLKPPNKDYNTSEFNSEEMIILGTLVQAKIDKD